MCRKFVFSLFLLLVTVATAAAEETAPVAKENLPAVKEAAPVAKEAAAAPKEAVPAAKEAAPAVAESAPAANPEPETRAVKGMSVLGNNEAPMSLFIVPWKTSELGVETNLTRTLNERDVPVDREVFQRELDFYRVSVEGKPQATALKN